MTGQHTHKWFTMETPPIEDGKFLIGKVPWICECGAVEKEGCLGSGESLSMELAYKSGEESWE